MYTREESSNGLPRPLRADIQLWIHLVRTYIECNYFNFIAAIEKENFLLNKSPGTLPRLLFFVFLYPIVFYVIFSAFFEFVVLAVYVAALETSTRLKSRDSRTCKQALEEDSGFTAAGEPLQVYPRETDGQSFRHGLVHGFA